MFADIEAMIGQTIAGYHLLQILGQGGMGAVFLGQSIQGEQQTQIAVKVLLPPRYNLSESRVSFQTRFMREARAMSQLHHPHIVPILSYGKLDEIAYIIMPYLSGGTLSSHLKLHKEPLSLQECCRYLTQLASALDYAHQQGIVHRDIKPGNVLLDAAGNIFLTDFGIARFFESDPDALSTVPVSLTMAGEVFGTPSYMAPELFRGEPAQPAADIYALGVLLYQLVTGRVPFQGKGALDVGIKHLSEAPLPPRSLRPELSELAEATLLCALAKSPADRFTSASKLATAFEVGLKSRSAVVVISQIPQSDRSLTQIQLTGTKGTVQAIQAKRDKQSLSVIHRPHNTRTVFIGVALLMLIAQGLIAGIVVGARNSHTPSSLTTLSTNVQKIPTPIQTRVLPNTPPPQATATATPPVLSTTPQPYTSIYDPSSILMAISNNVIYGLNKDASRILWSYITNGQIILAPINKGNTVYLVTKKGQVYALNITNGALDWTNNTHMPTSLPVSVQNGIVTLHTDSGLIYLFKADNGVLQTIEHPTPTATPIVRPTPTAGVTPTPTIGITPTPTAGVTPIPTVEVTPTPTSPPIAMPTSTAGTTSTLSMQIRLTQITD